jgi:bacterial/archaeal transporter family protein
MDVKTFGITLMTLGAWGIGTFIAKLATRRIGEKSVIWDLLGYGVGVMIFTLISFKWKDVIGADRTGMGLAFLAGAVGSIGSIGFYILVTRKDASVAVPMTAIYPALTAILAFIFLKEQLTIAKAAGIIISVAALYLLSL